MSPQPRPRVASHRHPSLIARILAPVHLTAWCLLLAIGSVALVYPAVATAGQEGDVEALRREVQQLREEMRELRGQREEAWMAESRREEVRQIVADAMDDAATRDTLDAGPVAGYRGGFFIGGREDDFHLRIGGVIKPRYTFSRMNNAPDGVDGSRGGFDMTSSRFSFAGHVIDPSWQYLFIVKINNQGNLLLLDSWVRKDLGGGFSITAGQFKLPFNYEYLVSEIRQQLVDRSLVSQSMAVAYSQGVMGTYQDDVWRLRLAFSDGARRMNTRWDSDNAEYAFTGRSEVKLAGGWGDYIHYVGFPGTDTTVVLGGAGHFQASASGTAEPVEHNARWTVDALAKGDRWSLFGAVVGSHTRERGGGGSDQYGVVAQGGYFITEMVELIGRYEWGHVNNDEPDLSVLSAGVNVFFNQHNLKWTTDVGYAFNGIGPTWASPGLGWREDRAGERGQVVVRTQFQLAF